MNQRLLVSRGLEQRSVRDLSFHNAIASRNLNYVAIPDRRLHCTLSLSNAHNISLDAISSIIRNKPTSSDRHHEAQVKDVITIGRDRRHEKVSYALELELDDQLQQEYQYLRGELNLNQKIYRPHITLLRTYDADESAEQKIIDHISQKSPETIALSGIQARLYTPTQRYTATPQVSRDTPPSAA